MDCSRVLSHLGVKMVRGMNASSMQVMIRKYKERSEKASTWVGICEIIRVGQYEKVRCYHRIKQRFRNTNDRLGEKNVASKINKSVKSKKKVSTTVSISAVRCNLLSGTLPARRWSNFSSRSPTRSLRLCLQVRRLRSTRLGTGPRISSIRTH